LQGNEQGVTLDMAGQPPLRAASAEELLEQQTGRSWILVQRGSAPPAWQALAFDSGFTLNQQLVPPDLTTPRPGGPK